jgi:hypothetical protein
MIWENSSLKIGQRLIQKNNRLLPFYSNPAWSKVNPNLVIVFDALLQMRALNLFNKDNFRYSDSQYGVYRMLTKLQP